MAALGSASPCPCAVGSDRVSILVIDDEPAIVRALDAVFGARGYAVTTAVPGRERFDIVMHATTKATVYALGRTPH